MSYKTVLVHLDESKRAELRIKIASDIAKQNEAHLIGTALTGISRFIYQDGNFSTGDTNLQIHLQLMRERAEKPSQALQKLLRRMAYYPWKQ